MALCAITGCAQGHLFREQRLGLTRTPRAQQITCEREGPRLGPKGVRAARMPYTIFLKLNRTIAGKRAPPYDEEFREVAMDAGQGAAIWTLPGQLTRRGLKQARGAPATPTLLEVWLLNVLAGLARHCAFDPQTYKHPRTRQSAGVTPSLFTRFWRSCPKERELIGHSAARKKRRVARCGLQRHITNNRHARHHIAP